MSEPTMSSEPVTSEPQAVDYPSGVIEITDKESAAEAPVARYSGGNTASSTYWAINDRTGRGTNIFNKGWLDVDINAMSQIAVSICELDANGNPFMGGAHMQILNVVPHSDSTVTVRYNVAWSTNLNYRFNFIVVN